jgi:hypothetical protein
MRLHLIFHLIYKFFNELNHFLYHVHKLVVTFHDTYHLRSHYLVFHNTNIFKEHFHFYRFFSYLTLRLFQFCLQALFLLFIFRPITSVKVKNAGYIK